MKNTHVEDPKQMNPVLSHGFWMYKGEGISSKTGACVRTPIEGPFATSSVPWLFFQCIKGRQECPQGILPAVCCRSRDIMNHLLPCSADDQNSRALELVKEFIWKLSTATLFFSPFLESKKKNKVPSVTRASEDFPGLSGDPFMDPWPFGTVGPSTALNFWRAKLRPMRVT